MNVGSLSFQKLEDVNLSLISKLGWKFLNNDNKSWVQMFHFKYEQCKYFLDYEIRLFDSFIWKVFCSSRKLLKNDTYINIRDGKLIDI